MTNLHMTDHNILEKTKTGQKSKNRAESPKKNINQKFSHFSSSWVLVI